MPKFIDITGQEFNNIKVIKRGPKKNNRIMWECQCHCGNTFFTEGYSLRTGHTKSCGCLKNINKINEIGNKYEKLTVIEAANSDSYGNSLWKCKCDCGNEVIILGKSLRNGSAKSCGCKRIEKLIEYNHTRKKDLLNQRFYNLVVVEELNKKNNSNNYLWKCLCDCGNYIEVSTGDLCSGNTKTCGCGRTKSFGEIKIKKILEENNINFVQEKSFQDLIFPDTKSKARFDFFVENKYIIEFDGIQHYKAGTGKFDNAEKFQKTQEHDKIKNEYCLKNNIPLIRIPYNEIDNIDINMLKLETSNFIVI